MKTQILSRLSMLVCLVTVLLLASCTQSLQQIVEKVEPATFTVYTYDEYGIPAGTGSGFFIESTGVGVTNWHVLDKSIKAVIKTPDGVQYEIDSVMCASSKKDILVFRIKNKANTVFKTVRFSKTNQKRVNLCIISAPLWVWSQVYQKV